MHYKNVFPLFFVSIVSLFLGTVLTARADEWPPEGTYFGISTNPPEDQFQWAMTLVLTQKSLHHYTISGTLRPFLNNAKRYKLKGLYLLGKNLAWANTRMNKRRIHFVGAYYDNPGYPTIALSYNGYYWNCYLKGSPFPTPTPTRTPTPTPTPQPERYHVYKHFGWPTSSNSYLQVLSASEADSLGSNVEWVVGPYNSEDEAYAGACGYADKFRSCGWGIQVMWTLWWAWEYVDYDIYMSPHCATKYWQSCQ
jgi:hypothetical protein